MNQTPTSQMKYIIYIKLAEERDIHIFKKGVNSLI